MMKYIDTDKQTFADLSIIESLSDEMPLYSLFSKTETKKGKRLMQEWLMYPLSDIRAIQNRQEAIAWNYLPELPLSEEELDFIEYYLEYREQIKAPNVLFSFAGIIDRWVKHDSYRYIIKRGVMLVIQLLYKLQEFSKKIPHDAPALLKEFSQTIEDLINGSEIREILEEESAHKPITSNYLIDKYDYLFRNTRLKSLKELLEITYQLDVCRTAHNIAEHKQFCCQPIMTQTMEFSINGFVHPSIDNGQTNDWGMYPGNISIFTGSNMAGKSTTLKALTISVWLAHCGLPIPATSMTCPVYEGIYTSINLPDSLRDGRSHFMAEILRIKEVLLKAKNGRRSIIILDEMFRGTNAQDAFEASMAVNTLLKQFPNCHFLISTHILEFAKSFETNTSCNFYYMDSSISNDQFICSHRLLKGISEVKVGYWLVQKELQGLI